eukprot:TRINITY_DN7152_c0_g1_i7.p1 TRINITY_DN7152_c0_g1~~TRINITY_DN7152_c0_g1_i7.p1  ORF type:complete len:160 (+),score=24.82 TRINITY_DN7152_c0_g1_i7:277-756(+)
MCWDKPEDCCTICYTNPKGQHCLGNYNSLDFNRSSRELEIEYTGGDMNQDGLHATTFIQVVCGEEDFQPISFALDPARNIYKISVRSNVVCSYELSGGSWFMIGLGGLFLSYLCVGCLVNFSQGQKGASLCPNVGFWYALVGLTCDGLSFTRSKLSSLF